jgi:hypothetical protein
MAIRRTARIAGLALIALVPLSCTSRPITVVVAFATAWTFDGQTLNADDRAVVEEATFSCLREAFEGFAVSFIRGDSGDRVIRVEDTPGTPALYQRLSLGAAGLTFPMSRVSSVRIDILFLDELAALHCPHLNACAMRRTAFLEGLGRGVGATAAHELGHQALLGFTHDSACADCYDGRSSRGYAHFFGVERWSAQAMSSMKQVLPVDRTSRPATRSPKLEDRSTMH